MAQATISARKDIRRPFNKSGGNRIKAALDACSDTVFAVADGSTVLSAFTLPTDWGKMQILDVWVIKTTATGGTTDAVQLCADAAGSNAISSSLALNTVAAGSVVRTTVVAPAYATIAKGGTLYVKRTHTTDCSVSMVIAARQVT